MVVPAINGELPMKILAIGHGKDLLSARFPHSDGKGVHFNIDFDTCLPKDKKIYKKIAPIVIENKENISITGVHIDGNESLPAIIIKNSKNIKISSSFISKGQGIEVEQSENIKIEANIFANYSTNGIRVSENSSEVSITDNRFVNPQKPIILNENQESDTNSKTFSIVLDNITSSRNVIKGNRFLMQEGKSHTSDIIKVINSAGTEKSPIKIIENYIMGGIGDPEAKGISIEGGLSQHILISQNTLLNTGHVGIALSGGSHISVIGNTVYSVGHPHSSVGIYSWNLDKKSPCKSHSIKFNRVKVESTHYQTAGFFNSEECGVTLSQNDFNDNSLIGGDFFERDFMCENNSGHYQALDQEENSLTLDN